MNKHTPTPWAHRNGRIFAADRENLTVANIARAFDGDYSPENGEHIVRCVNSHDALVRIAELVQHAAQNRADRDWTQFHLDLSEAAELAKQVAPLAAAGAPQ